MRRLFGVLALTGAVVSTIACGGTSTSPTPGGTVTVPQPFTQTISGSVGVFGTTRHSLSVPRSGSMVVRLTWSDGAVDLDLYLAPTSCTSLYPFSACGILATSDAATGTSEQVSRSVNANESFNLYVDNLDTSRSQSYTLSISVQ